jgi:hypothetical protein
MRKRLTMDQARFWKIIEGAKHESHGDPALQLHLVEKALIALPLPEVVTFHRIYCAFYEGAECLALWQALKEIVGLVSDDRFAYLRA